MKSKTQITFLHSDDLIFQPNEIAHIDFSRVEDLIVTGQLKSGVTFTATNIVAIELIMSVKPSVFEGRRLQWPKFVWVFHNVVAHPLMQILAILGLYRYAFILHDMTVPRPIGKKEKAK